MITRVVPLLMWLSVAVLPSNVKAQHPDRLVHTLAQAAVAECGWFYPDCHVGTWGTLERLQEVRQKRRPGYTLLEMALRYCSIFKGIAVDESRKQWVRSLPRLHETHEDVAPKGWPQGSIWGRHSAKWRRIYVHAQNFVDGKVRDRCDGSPTHFGAGKELEKFHPGKWRFVDCGRTGGQRFLERR